MDNEKLDQQFIKPTENMKLRRAGEREEVFFKKGDTSVAKITIRGDNSTENQKFCFNIEKPDDQLYQEVEKWCRINNDNEVLVIYDHARLQEAKPKKLNNWKDNKVFDEVENSVRNTIAFRWVITESLDENCEPIIKAHLLARGFEENMTEEQRRDSPTCTKDSLRLVLSVFGANSRNCDSIDIKSVFLQGNEIDCEISVKLLK